MQRTFTLFLVSLWVMVANASGQTVDADWLGTTGNWSDATQWSTVNFPNNGNGGVDYDVLIENNGRVSIDVNATVKSLLFSGAELNGTGNTLTVNESMCWQGGFIQGAGISELLGGGTFEGSTKSLRNDHVINNHATITWSAGDMNSGTGVVINNLNTGAFEFSGGVSLLNNFGGVATQFNNMGIVRTLSGAGTNTIRAPFNSTGAVQILGGDFRLEGGGNSSGSFTVADQATLVFQGSNGGTFLNGASISGNGDVEFRFLNDVVGGSYDIGGTTSIINGTTNFDLPTFQTEHLTMTGSGVLQGSLDGLVSSTFTFSGGTLARAGRTTVMGNLILDGSVRRLSDEHTLVNEGSASWTSGNFNTGLGSVFENGSLATMDASSDADFLSNLGGVRSRFVNHGVFSKTGGTDVTQFNAQFENFGTVNVDSGTIEIVGPILTSGEFNVLNGSLLRLGNQGSLLGSGSRFVGAGNLEFSGGTHDYFVADGEFLLTGYVELASNANVFFEEPITINELIMTSGTRRGTAVVTVDQSFQFNGGTFQGNGVTNARGNLFMAGAAKRLQSDHVFNNFGNAEWTAGDFNTGLGAEFVNHQGAVFEVLHDARFLSNLGGTLTVFDNRGTVSKNSGSGLTTFSANVLNSGTWKVDSGTFQFARGMTQNDGTFSLGGGSVEVGTNQVLSFLGGIIQGVGSIVGDVEVLGGTIQAGQSVSGLNRTGALSITGDVDLADSCVIEFDIRSVNGPEGTTWDFIDVDGEVDLAPMGSVAGVTIEMVSLDAMGSEGMVPDFNAGDTYSWPIIRANSIAGFDANSITIDASGFSNAPTAQFSVGLESIGAEQQLVIMYQGVSVLLGDVNMDGVVNLLDVGPFIDALTNGLFIDEADMNRDGAVNLLDVSFFVDALAGP